MSSPAPHVVPIFATPFGVDRSGGASPESRARGALFDPRPAPMRTAIRQTSTSTIFSE